jgi:hypothetical protein
MKNTYEHAIAIFLKRYRGLVATETYYTDAHEFWNSIYYELVDFYNYINSKDITYTYEDELNYLKVRYLIEKFIHYCGRVKYSIGQSTRASKGSGRDYTQKDIQ